MIWTLLCLIAPIVLAILIQCPASPQKIELPQPKTFAKRFGWAGIMVVVGLFLGHLFERDYRLIQWQTDMLANRVAEVSSDGTGSFRNATGFHLQLYNAFTPVFAMIGLAALVSQLVLRRPWATYALLAPTACFFAGMIQIVERIHTLRSWSRKTQPDQPFDDANYFVLTVALLEWGVILLALVFRKHGTPGMYRTACQPQSAVAKPMGAAKRTGSLESKY